MSLPVNESHAGACYDGILPGDVIFESQHSLNIFNTAGTYKSVLKITVSE